MCGAECWRYLHCKHRKLQNTTDLIQCNSWEKEVKGFKVEIEEAKLTLFANSMIIYLENPKESTKKQLECLSEFGKPVGDKVNPWKKATVCLYNWKNVNWFIIYCLQ